MLLIDYAELNSGETTVVTPRGPLTSATAPALENAIEGLVRDAAPFIILDASGLEYASSAGIGMILHVHRSIASRNGSLVVCNLPGEMLSLFRLIGFDRAIDVADTVEEAKNVIADRRAGKGSGAVPPPERQPGPDQPEKRDRAEAPAIPDDSPEPSVRAVDGFDKALVVECAECGGLVRVRRSGTYQCPHCRVEFSVEKDQTVIF
ncbi:MAG TPA: STAS domain-containing protein [Spirochaetota bacterium]|nr:STAS domain-containing protein [Spirochaetota bacterium]